MTPDEMRKSGVLGVEEDLEVAVWQVAAEICERQDQIIERLDKTNSMLEQLIEFAMKLPVFPTGDHR